MKKYKTIFKCPGCGTKLHLTITKHQIHNGMATINTQCTGCNNTFIIKIPESELMKDK